MNYLKASSDMVALDRLCRKDATPPPPFSAERLPVTRRDIEDLLAEGYGKGQVAKALKISKSTLHRRLKEKG